MEEGHATPGGPEKVEKRKRSISVKKKKSGKGSRGFFGQRFAPIFDEKEKGANADDGYFPMDTQQNIPLTSFKRTAGAQFDKSLFTIAQPTVANTQVNVTLLTTGFPCELTGFRWMLDTLPAGTFVGIQSFMALQYVRQGDTPGNISLVNGNTFDTPEQDVILYDAGQSSASIANSTSTSFRSYQSSNRRYRSKVGDKVVFSLISNTQPVTCFGAVELWCNA